jgi:hypothetical protein
MNRVWPCLVLPVLFGGLCLTSFAGDQPPVPDEFAVSQSISMTEQDEAYISPSIAFSKFAAGNVLAADADLAYGITDRLELEADVPYSSLTTGASFGTNTVRRSANGVGDVTIDGRYGVIDFREHPFSLDAELSISAPTGDHTKGLGDGRVLVSPSFTASQWIGRHFNAELNAAWIRAVGNASFAAPADQYVYNITLAYMIQRWYLVVEGNGFSTSQTTSYAVTPEIIWKPTKLTELRVACPITVTHPRADYSIVAGFTVEFENLFHRHAEGQSDND